MRKYFYVLFFSDFICVIVSPFQNNDSAIDIHIFMTLFSMAIKIHNNNKPHIIESNIVNDTQNVCNRNERE